VIPENTPTGTVLGVVPANNPNQDSLTYRISSGNISNTFAIDDSGSLSVADDSLLDYEALAGKTKFPVQFEMFVDILNPKNPVLNETNRRVVVAITNVNESPDLLAPASGASMAVRDIWLQVWGRGRSAQ
jgi:hypothetical protein